MNRNSTGARGTVNARDGLDAYRQAKLDLAKHGSLGAAAADRSHEDVRRAAADVWDRYLSVMGPREYVRARYGLGADPTPCAYGDGCRCGSPSTAFTPGMMARNRAALGLPPL